VKRELTLIDAALGLLVIGGGVATLCFAFFSLMEGRGWQAVAFARGGLYLSLWAGLRLTR
jgi:hypothetical protein